MKKEPSKKKVDRLQATYALLDLFAKKRSRKAYLDAVLDLLLSWSDSRCGGIRVLTEQKHIPYECYRGFSRQFWESENGLSILRDHCACTRIFHGKPAPKDLPRMTPGGSFRCDNILTFVRSLSQEDLRTFRGICVAHGYRSVAVIPIRYDGNVLAAIHLADEREGKVSEDVVEFIESVAPLIGEAIHRFNLEEEIRESENRLRLLSGQLLTAQEDERKRFARDLHDSLGASLAAIKYALEDVLSKIAPKQEMSDRDSVVCSLEKTITRVQETIEEVRRIQMDLRPATLDDLGLLPTISWVTREFQKVYSRKAIEKTIDVEEAEIPEHLKTVIYRVIQEALNNIAKHSQAKKVILSLTKRKGQLELRVEDNGVGFDAVALLSKRGARKGFGLTSMRERTELTGGIFTIDSAPGEGVRICAVWPLPP